MTLDLSWEWRVEQVALIESDFHIPLMVRSKWVDFSLTCTDLTSPGYGTGYVIPHHTVALRTANAQPRQREVHASFFFDAPTDLT
jgi:hypothetical protein